VVPGSGVGEQNSVNPSQMSVVTKCFCEFCKNVNHRLNKWMSTECFISLLVEITWSLYFTQMFKLLLSRKLQLSSILKNVQHASIVPHA
jgi:hypothetical protein